MEKNSANITEIFSSIQGEGIYLGKKQIFIRFSGCNLDCDYCDTNYQCNEYCNVYDNNKVKPLRNPVFSEDLMKEVINLNPGIHHSISLTGGEPLMSHEFLKKFLKELKKIIPGIDIYLETNGTLPHELKSIISYIDTVAMDIKIQSSTGKPLPYDEHTGFIRVLESFDKEYFIKIVVTPDITPAEIGKVKAVLSNCRNSVPLIIQPESRIGFEDKFLEIQSEFLKDLNDVRIIPQVHRFLKLK